MSAEYSSQEPNSGYPRLESQIAWYDQKSSSAQKMFKRVKMAEIVCASLVPLLANIHGVVTGILGIGVVILESLQHLNQWQHNWITYRSTCEALRHEKYAFLGRIGPYEKLDDDAAKGMLVGRIESLISTEHSKWVKTQECISLQLRSKGENKQQ